SVGPSCPIALPMKPFGRELDRLLYDELRALADRTGARDAFVVDAHSPVVWGAATLAPDGGAPSSLPDGSLRTLDDVRSLSTLDQLARGRHLRHVVIDEGGGYLAHSFASIYLVVLVFDRLY